jgi:hypothetical protein
LISERINNAVKQHHTYHPRQSAGLGNNSTVALTIRPAYKKVPRRALVSGPYY